MGWSDSPSHRRQRRRACNGCHCRVQEQARSQYRRGSRVVHPDLSVRHPSAGRAWLDYRQASVAAFRPV